MKSLSNETLFFNLKEKVREERKVTLEVLKYLREVDSRRLHALYGYSSLHEFCVKELKFSSGAAYRRIESMRLLKDLPEVEEKIEDGKLNLSSLSTFQSFLKAERQEQKKEYAKEEKLSVLSRLENASSRETEKILYSISPPSVPTKRDREEVLSATESRIHFTADQELLELLNQVKEKLGGKNAFPDYQKLFKCLARAFLKSKKPRDTKTPKETGKLSGPAPAPGTPCVEKQLWPEARVALKPQAKTGNKIRRSRYISGQNRALLDERSQGRCEFISPITAKRCENRCALQIEHKTPFAKGGTAETSNLEFLCPAHNRLRAIQAYGVKKMEPYLRL